VKGEKMSCIVVIAFDDEEEAGKVRESLRKVEKDDYLSLDDSAVIVKDKDGKIHVKDEVDRGVKIGALSGGLVGKMVAPGIDKKFIEDVSETLTPGTSAIFFIVRSAYPDAALGVLKLYKGKVLHTSFPPETEESLRLYLKQGE
jgi:uncharacterized membrane protein